MINNVWALLLVALAAGSSGAMTQDLPPRMVAGWDAYIAENDRQVEADEAASSAFLAQDIYDTEEARRCEAEVLAGDVCIVKVVLVREGRFPVEVEDALVHHWVGSILVPGATLDEALEFVKAYGDYPRYFAEVTDAGVLEQDGDTLHTFMRLKRTKILTVYFYTEHEVTFTRYGPRRASSRSVSTRIRELDRAGEADEREKDPTEDRGLLWRLNANWKYEEVDDGVILEAEVISLSRRIPWGFGWAVGPFVDSVPRESLEMTLTTLRDALSSPAAPGPSTGHATK